MSADDNRKPAAHEQLNQIANQLDAGQGMAAPQPSRPQPVYPPASAAAAAPDQTSAPSAPEQVAGETPDAAPAAAPAVSAGWSGKAKATVAVARDEPRMRSVMITYFPMLIAIMSLALSLYQGYLFSSSLDVSRRSLDLMERNVARGEYTRACRDIIETYFQIKPKVSALMPVADRGNVAGASRISEQSRLEAQAAIAKFGGLGTYLANFQDPGTRARYTELTRTLNGILDSARTTQLTDLDKLFEPADKIFASMNEDCVRLARTMRM
jgi:hypothetical protein